MFDSIEAVLVRRVNISRAHRAGLVLGERQSYTCVCVSLSVCDMVTQVKCALLVNLDHPSAVIIKTIRKRRKQTPAYFCLSGFRILHE